MYEEYWGLNRPPFENVPNREIFFPSAQHQEALLRLLYAVEQNKGVAMLTGEVGSGKTTVSRALVDRISKEKYEFQTIVNPALDPVDFIRAILMNLGEPAESDSKVELLSRLQDRLMQNAQRGVRTVLIIDEAHLLKNQGSLEELRMLLNLQDEHQFLITLIIMGQPPLQKTVGSLKPLAERIAIKYNLTPLDIRDTVRYILFRLKNAGATRGIFTKEAIFPIFDFSKGLPLRINKICDRSLLIGMMRRAKGVDTYMVNEAIEDII